MQNTAKMFVQKIFYIIAMNDANMHGQMLRFIQGLKEKKGLDKKSFWSNWKKKYSSYQ